MFSCIKSSLTNAHDSIFLVFSCLFVFFFLIITEFKKYIKIDSPKSNHVKKSNPSSERCINPNPIMLQKPL